MTNVVITGSTKGIGFGLARECADRGFNVVITGRSQGSVDDALHKMGQVTGAVYGKPCDVSDRSAVESLWAFAISKMGGVDIWVNNAGLARTQWPITETPASDIETMVTTNMLGTINGCVVAAKAMSEAGSGKIFNMLGGGSDGEYFPGMGVYGTTKRGLNYFTDAMVKELKDSPLIVGKIRPGMIITEAVVREAREDLVSFEKSRKMMNNLVDQVETVSPFLVDEMLKCEKSGHKIVWLTKGKMMGRMLKGMISKREDQFERHGL